MNRLYDIEKATFNGVLNYLETHEEEFHNHKIFINSLPAHQLEGEDGEKVRDRIADYPGRIVVEYTEGSEFADTALIKHHEAFDTLNIEVALDDYGSGYSNVNNLIRYTPRYVKIDRMLISNINESAQKRHFVLSIVEYAKKNNIQVLAEGVETLDELRTVISLGVDLIQGYYTGRPAKKPIESIDEDIRTQIKRFNYFPING
jgi:EAL domain-containing protein (putative c-di-GMP-specific phosphodiesterase class I)